MAFRATELCRRLPSFHWALQFSCISSISLHETQQESVRTAVETKKYDQIPELLASSRDSSQNPNPFSFLSMFPHSRRTQIVDEMLQSFIHLKPRSCTRNAYACLLSHTLQSPCPLPLAFTIVQRSLRSGCIPAPETHALLSSAWLDRRHKLEPVSTILLEMESIGYSPDCGTCNYLISSLCAVDQLEESVKVLKGMSIAGCPPDLDSYGSVINAMATIRRTTDAVDVLKEMVRKHGLTPRQQITVKLLKVLRAKQEVQKAVETIEFLERESCPVGFKGYEVVVEGCLECRQFLLAGKLVMRMTSRGFIPFIEARHKLIEGLASAGEKEFACALRKRFAKLRS